MSDRPSFQFDPAQLPEGIKLCTLCGKPYKDTGEGCTRCLEAADKESGPVPRRALILAAILVVLLIIYWTKPWDAP